MRSRSLRCEDTATAEPRGTGKNFWRSALVFQRNKGSMAGPVLLSFAVSPALSKLDRGNKSLNLVELVWRLPMARLCVILRVTQIFQ